MNEEITMVSIVFPDRSCRFIRKTDVEKMIQEWQKKHAGGCGRRAFCAIQEVNKLDGTCNEIEFIEV